MTPAWYAERFGKVAAHFAALPPAEPEPRQERPLAPVRSLDGARVEKAARAMAAMIRKAV